MGKFRKILLFAGLSILLLSCTETEKKNAWKTDSVAVSTISPPTTVDSTIKSVVKTDSLRKDSTDKVIQIDGVVYYTSQYCGGARPTEEMMAEYEKPKLLSNSTLILKNKKHKFFITTDSKGNFEMSLPSETFDVYLTEKVNKSIYVVSAEHCGVCLTIPFSTVKIKSGKKARIDIAFHCSQGDLMRP